MPSFGAKSRERLATCHAQLQDVCNEAIKHFDFSVTCGTRDKSAQNQAFAQGKSQKRWPDSKHNSMPSLAVDVVPWDSINRRALWGASNYEMIQIGRLVQVMLDAAVTVGVTIEAGGDWARFNDPFHFQLTNTPATIPNT